MLTATGSRRCETPPGDAYCCGSFRGQTKNMGQHGGGGGGLRRGKAGDEVGLGMGG